MRAARTLIIGLLGLIAIGALVANPLSGTAVRQEHLPPGAAGRLAAGIMPSVVDVRSQGGGVQPGRIAIGTGVIVDSTGLIVTNDHVVTGESTQPGTMIDVVLHDGRQLQATLVGRDPSLDLALLRVAADNLPAARFVTGADHILGEAVVAIGAPGLLPRTVAAGSVTAIRQGMHIPGRPGLTTVLETSACLMPGYSGGPTVDRRGRVVGISFAGTPGKKGPDCRAFAIPSETVLSVVNQLAAGEQVPVANSTPAVPSIAPALAAP